VNATWAAIATTWAALAILATALFVLLGQNRHLADRMSDGFSAVRAEISELRAELRIHIDRHGWGQGQ
jgi:hypothetical protein